MFTTDRLLLRGIDVDRDLNEFSQGGNDAGFLDLISPAPRVPSTTSQSKETLKEFSNRKLPMFAICLKSATPEAAWPQNLKPDESYHENSPTAIGFVSLQDRNFNFKNRVAYVGLSFRDPQHRGKGFGTEVLNWLQRYAFLELGLHKLALEVYENNAAAQRCYEKVGFRVEGRLRKTYWQGGRWWDIMSMGLLEEEFYERERLTNSTREASK